MYRSLPHLLLIMSICLLVSTATATPVAAASNSYTWESIHLPTGVPLPVVNDLAIDPDDATIIWLSTNAGLYRSTNAGTSWSPVAPSTLSYVRKVIIAPSNAQRIFAISWSVYRSEDGGSTWSAINAPASTCDLVIAPSNAERVYARVCASGQPTLARSDDGGQSWLTPNTLFTTSLDSLVVAPNQPNVLIGGGYTTLVRSDDSGASWATVPIGTHYYNQPVFDPQAPYMLYLGHWTGLLRSSNAGLSWEDSHVDQQFSTLIASPISADMVLGGNTTNTWQMQSIEQRWSSRSWDAPTGLQMLWRSANDSTFLYARSSAGLWRYVQQVQPAMPYRVFLPLIRQNNDTTASVAQQALDQANMYRRIARVSDLHIHSTITTAAQNHADYHMANYANSAAWTNGAHGEVAGIPGYTGTWPSNRLAATGYPWSGESSEVMHFIGDPIASVDDWMATIYHRLILLNPDAHYAGYGNGKSSQTAVDVMDFGSGPANTGAWLPDLPYPSIYPADGQTDIPTEWSSSESPDPLPPGASRPVGYPFTIQGVGGTLHISAVELRDSSRHIVAIHPNPSACDTYNCYALIAVSPLHARSTYTIYARGDVDGVAFEHTWSFSTR